MAIIVAPINPRSNSAREASPSANEKGGGSWPAAFEFVLPPVT